MKSALNGGLNLSIRDGWWDELYDGANGWAIPTADGIDDPDRRDDLEANALYELLATQVAPAFYDRTAGVPTALGRDGAAHPGHARPAGAGHPDGARVRRATGTCPAARAAARIEPTEFAPARELAAFRARLDSAWPSVAVTGVDASGLPDTPVVGAPMTVRAVVALAGLDPADVAVEAVVGRVDDTDELSDAVVVPMKHVGSVDGEGGGGRPGRTGSSRWCTCRSPG